jgi:hypothetical protein
MQGNYIAFSPSLGLEQMLAEHKLVRVPLAEARRSDDRFAVIVHAAGLGPAPRAFLEFGQKMTARHHPKLKVRR